MHGERRVSDTEPIMTRADHHPMLPPAVRDSIDHRRQLVWDDYCKCTGSTTLLIGFRKLDDVTRIKQEFTAWQYAKSMVWLNGLAVWLTKPPGATAPNGEMCHAEIMIQIRQNEWARFSINKKQYLGKDERGIPQFEWGRVHATIMGPRETEWRKKYCFLQFDVHSRECLRPVFELLVTQESGPFNYWGYMLNNFCCCSAIGTSFYDDNLATKQEKWFCTEIIHAAMQCAAISEMRVLSRSKPKPNTWQEVILSSKCCKSNPNWMYDRLAKCCNVVLTLAPNSKSQKSICLGNS